MKVIAFSLWGRDPKYTVGAIRNAELAKIHYPDWRCWFYVGYSTYAGEQWDIVDQLEDMDHVDIIYMNEPGDWRGMFWRFDPASMDEVEVFISRDCDSRLGAREAAAVDEWLAGPKLVHSMGDHPHHFNPSLALMGGMFGMKKYACPQMAELIETFVDDYPDALQCDQDFLKHKVWPVISTKVLAHSDWHPSCTLFPMPRTENEFIGSIIGPNEEQLHPEHHAMIPNGNPRS